MKILVYLLPTFLELFLHLLHESTFVYICSSEITLSGLSFLPFSCLLHIIVMGYPT